MPDRVSDSPARLLTVEDAAGFLSVSRSRLYELIAAGELSSVSIGRSRRVSLGDLEEFVESRRRPGTDTPG